MKEFGYYIWQNPNSQNPLRWPMAGFQTREDAELMLMAIRKQWPSNTGNTFILKTAAGETL